MDQFQMIVLLAGGALTMFAFSEKLRVILLKPIAWLFFRPHQEIRSTMDERCIELSQRIEEVSVRQEAKIIEMNAMCFGVLAMLHDLIYGYYEQYLLAGEISVMEKKNLESLYTAYSNMGGNGTGHDMYMDVCKLPIKFEQ